MTDKIAEWIEKLATGKKARIFWAIVIALIVALFILFPFIDANLLFYNRIETRINNLEKLVSISGMTVSEDPSLHAEYQDILLNMETARQNSVVNVNQELKTLKTMAAAMLANTWNNSPALERTKEPVWMWNLKSSQWKNDSIGCRRALTAVE